MIKPKRLRVTLAALLAIALSVISCNKQEPDTLSGTTWWTEMAVDSSSGDRCHMEFTFTEDIFTQVTTFPFSPAYPPTRYVGTYTYSYPHITLVCTEYKDVAIMNSDRKSFTIGSYIFIKDGQ